MILTGHLYLQPRLRKSETISLLPIYTSMVWTGINLAVLVVVVVGWLLYVVVVVVVGCCMLLLLLFHCCLGEEQPLLYVLIFNRSHFTQFHLHHCPLTRKFTQLSYSHNNLPFIAI